MLSLLGSLRRAQRVSPSLPASLQARGYAVAYKADADFHSYDPPGRGHLYVPGPVNIHERVMRAMTRPPQNHRDPWFNPWFKSILEETKTIFKTKEGTTFIFPGTGTGGWESALTNTLSPGDRIVTFRFGQFSHLWVDMMERMGLEVTVIDSPWGEGANEEKLAEVLKADTEKKIKAVAVVHNETATGVTSDIGEVRRTMDAAGSPALLLVDGVSSIGALDFKFDEWRVDVAVTGSQKALSLPTGLGVLAVSPKALNAQKTATSKRCYYDWADQLRTNPTGDVPYTPVLPLLYGMKESLALINSEGIDNVIERHHRLATATRKAVDAWGLQLLCKNPRWRSDSLSVIEVPRGVDSGDVVKYAYSKYNLSLGVGLSKVAGKVFRIGHLGNMDEVMLLSALSGAEMALLDVGIKITPGAGVGAAISHLQATSTSIRGRELQ